MGLATTLPAYRRIHFRIMIRAAARHGDAIAVELRPALARYDAVALIERGPYYKDEALLEFDAELEPTGAVGECVDALRASAATGWDDSPVGPAWGRPDDGTTFLHPALEWATVSPEEAATLPRYVSGDLVRILDCPAARRDGLVGAEAEIRGYAVPVDDSDVWGYSVRPATWETLICFDEPQLAPTGRRARERPVARQIVSVRPDGTVTGYWSR
ncbi:MAG TPA: hypothetical protein VFR67_30440 [Pilimelia sp.]|nr:hypothetical protein [Pilimelia sp.]